MASSDMRKILHFTISNTSWWPQKPKNLSSKRVELYIDSSVTGWIVMRNMLENSQDHLVRGFKEHLKVPTLLCKHCNTTDITAADNFIIHPSIRTLASTICHIHGMMLSLPPQNSNKIINPGEETVSKAWSDMFYSALV